MGVYHKADPSKGASFVLNPALLQSYSQSGLRLFMTKEISLNSKLTTKPDYKNKCTYI